MNSSATLQVKIPRITPPSAIDNPYIIGHNGQLEGTVFVVVGSVAGFAFLCIFAWWSIMKYLSHKNAKLAFQHDTDSNNNAASFVTPAIKLSDITSSVPSSPPPSLAGYSNYRKNSLFVSPTLEALNQGKRQLSMADFYSLDKEKRKHPSILLHRPSLLSDMEISKTLKSNEVPVMKKTPSMYLDDLLEVVSPNEVD